MRWNKTIKFIVLISTISMVILSNFLYNKWYGKLLSTNTNIIYGIIVKKTYFARTGPATIYEYRVANVKYQNYLSGISNFIKGDTILIKYSLKNPNVIEVIDLCYMRKCREKKHCK